jgi:hypothetical protein
VQRASRLAVLLALPSCVAFACETSSSNAPLVGDGGLEAGPDGSLGLDAGPIPSEDAGSALDAGVVPFCADAAAHDFCADFDEGNTLAADGLVPGLQHGYEAGVGQIVSTVSVSPPDSLVVELVSLPGDAAYYLRKSLGRSASKSAALALDVWVESLDVLDPDGAPPSIDARVGALGDSAYEIDLDLTKSGSALYLTLGEAFSADAGYVTHVYAFSGQPFQAQAWHRVALRIDYAAAAVTVSLDGVAGTQVAPVTQFHVPSSSGSLFFDVGARVGVGHADVKVFFDDLAIDIDR